MNFDRQWSILSEMAGVEGAKVTKAAKKPTGKKIKFVRQVIHEVAGFSPYERRAMDLLKLDKRRTARVFLKRRLGTHRRAMDKLNKLEQVLQEEALEHQA